MQTLKTLLTQLQSRKIQALLVLDFLLLPLALLTSVFLRLGGNWDHHLDHDLWLFIALPFWTIPIFINLGLYKAVIKYLDEKVIFIVFIGVSLSVLILAFIIRVASISSFPLTSIIIFWIFALAYIGGTRIILRGILRNLNNNTRSNVAIYGAGMAGAQLCIALQNNIEYNPIAFFDDNSRTHGRTIRGVQVFSPQNLADVIRHKNIKQILIAIPSASNAVRQKIIKQLEPLSLKIKTLPGIDELISGEVTINDIKEVDIEDLLSRDSIPPDIALLQKNITHKSVLVTGAGGSIGSELVRQIAHLEPKLLILFDVSEFSLYSIEKEVLNTFPKLKVLSILGSVTDKELIARVLKTYHINTIYHAAAYKHVPIIEYNPIIGIYNNALGTLNLALHAKEHKVDTMVLISTDKAVRPTNVMGASKRLAELILQALNQESIHTVFTSVRFGNVLGSSGSVVPLFSAQIKAGGPVTVTHAEVTRYLMTIKEAVQLVIQASTMANGGEVFVLDMGKPVKILDLAKQMIHLSGFSVKDELHPAGDIEIKITGLRPGEKLYEELLIGDVHDTTSHPRIMQAHETFIAYTELKESLDKLENALQNYDFTQAIAILQTLVTEYTSTQHYNLV